MTERDIVDDIDALIDEQLAEGPVDDYTVDRYDECPKCERNWHGMPLTLQVAVMHSFGAYDDEYDAAKDNSPIVCPGSEVDEPLPEFTAEMQHLARRYAIIMMQKLGQLPAELNPNTIERITAPWRTLGAPGYNLREWFGPMHSPTVDYIENVMTRQGVMLSYPTLNITVDEALEEVPTEIWQQALNGFTPHVGARVLATRSDGRMYTGRIMAIDDNTVTLESVPTPTEEDRANAEYRGVAFPNPSYGRGFAESWIGGDAWRDLATPDESQGSE